jgi:hypothetical protein
VRNRYHGGPNSKPEAHVKIKKKKNSRCHFKIQAFRTGDMKHVPYWMPTNIINLLAPEFGIYILSHPVCKMRIIQEPKKVAL